MNKTDLDVALADVELIRQVLEDQGRNRPHSHEVLILSAMAIIDLGLLAIEISTGGGVTQNFLLSQSHDEFKLTGLMQIFGVLILCVGGVYWLAWTRARELGSTVDRVIGREMPYLTFHSFVPDLLLKFTVLSTVIWMDAPHLCGPLLTAFVADYILQGRFFRMPRNLSYVLATLTYAFGFFTITTGAPSVMPAAIAFLIAALISIANITFVLRKPMNE